MKKILVIIICLFTLNSCKDKSLIDIALEDIGINVKSFRTIDTLFHNNKSIRRLRFTVAKGEYTDVYFYESGNKKTIHRNKNRQVHGKFSDWYENGNIKWSHEYKNGKQIGMNINYRSDGSIKIIRSIRGKLLPILVMEKYHFLMRD